jgi:hypothetical protein
MTFSFPDDLPEDWEDDIGMIEDADFLNKVGGMSNAIKQAFLSVFCNTGYSFVATNESTTLATYAPLATPGEASVNVGNTGIVIAFLKCQFVNTTQAMQYMSCELSGANEIAPNFTDKYISERQPIASSTAVYTMNGYIPYMGLDPGATVFKTQFATSGGTAHFLNREIFLLPFP